MNNLSDGNMVELSFSESENLNGGIFPVAVAVWWAGATIAAKCGVVAAGAATVAAGAAVGAYTGFKDTEVKPN
ncbi:hypothetical protein A3SI_16405 [Nitritalea halalkaliphila LW7]|uniref:Class IIb bacteriocin, lactobin A/cerein 7B family n=1 Tax=Nitritalea halalkaliphila LW7 TaxID=1189621 RepID=I5BWZ4_9BACT|nr:hypothetical protein [Nitritalea halalkaliphila]EIM74096.1 hypothetical protein A3SI_16405 [Nitritalea halalkaliphila LW7]